ncbi:MAG: Lrp/AsnC family transcriptional regulator [Thermoplasmatota archaeon]
MSERGRMDERDRIIISLLSEDPHISQEEIARRLGLRQPSVTVRVRKLRESGHLEVQAGVNPFRIGLQMAKVDVRTTNPTKLLSVFERCPYFLNGLLVSGKSNLCLFFVAERISTLEAIVDHHLRAIPEVQDVDFNIVISSAKRVVMPVALGRAAKEGARDGEPQCGGLGERGSPGCADCPIAKEGEGWFF